MKKFGKIVSFLVAFALVVGMSNMTVKAAATDNFTDAAFAGGVLDISLTGVAYTDVYGVTFYTTPDAAQMADAETWMGGGVGFNSTSTGWLSIEWGKASGEKPIVYDESGVIKYLSDTALFTADDTWAQAWLQAWGGDMTIDGIELLGADGAVLYSAGAVPAAAAATGDALPQTGTADTVLFFAAGLCLVAAGGVLLKRRHVI